MAAVKKAVKKAVGAAVVRACVVISLLFLPVSQSFAGTHTVNDLNAVLGVLRGSGWAYAYVKGNFDCSNMAMFLSELLTDAFGYSCCIVEGTLVLGSADSPPAGHCMVIVFCSDPNNPMSSTPVWVEPTTLVSYWMVAPVFRDIQTGDVFTPRTIYAPYYTAFLSKPWEYTVPLWFRNYLKTYIISQLSYYGQ